MKSLIFTLIVFAFATGIALLLHGEPGYITLNYANQWTAETSLATFVGVVAGAFLVLYLGALLLLWMSSLPRRLKGHMENRRNAGAAKILSGALIEMIKGDYAQAERHLIKSQKNADLSMASHLLAAFSAEQRSNIGNREQYLNQAAASGVNAEHATAILRARFNLNDQQPEQSKIILDELAEKSNVRSATMLSLQTEVEISLGNWDAAQQRLIELGKQKQVPSEQLKKLERKIWQGLLSNKKGEELSASWRSLPKHANKYPEVVTVYAEQLLNSGQHELAEKVIREAVSGAWDDALVELYGQVKSPESGKQIAQAEKWLARQPDNASILLTVGVLNARAQLWGKARSCLQSSLSISPSAAAYQTLGDLLLNVDEEYAAYECYQKGLRQLVGQKSISVQHHPSDPASNPANNPTSEEITTLANTA